MIIVVGIKNGKKEELVDISPIRPIENDEETDNVPTMPLNGDEEEAKERK